MSWKNCLGVVAAGAWAAALSSYHSKFIEAQTWRARCASNDAILPCYPRAGLLWMQAHAVSGLAALVFGLWALIAVRRGIGFLAVLSGTESVIDDHATWGVLGLSLGIWAWFMPGGESRG